MAPKSATKAFAEPINGIDMNGSVSTTFNGLCAVGFLARASYALARTPVSGAFRGLAWGGS